MELMENGKTTSVMHSTDSLAQKAGRFPRVRLQTRLILILLGIVVPLLLLINVFLTIRVEAYIRSSTTEQLSLRNNLLLANMGVWLDSNQGIINQLAVLDDVTDMQPEQQKAVLEKTGKAFPGFYLIHIMGLSGMDTARSDGKVNSDYADRDYFKDALAGKPVAYQVLISRTTNQPALAVSVPIQDASGQVVGVVAGMSELTMISKQITRPQGATNASQAFIVDANNQVIAHTDPAISARLTDYTTYPPVAALRHNVKGAFSFVDGQGRRWLAFVSRMENGWGIVTQVEEASALALVYQSRQNAWIFTASSILVMLLLSWFLINRSLRPITQLTAAARAIATGDLESNIELEQSDEVGELASAFHSMTQQLRASIQTLEKGVADRTRVVETTAEVSRHLSMILDQSQLVREVVDQLQQAFHYYHVHIYLLDDAQENLVMVGGSGEPGRIMLARSHRIPRGKGLVGRAAQTNQPVLVSNTLQDPGWLPNALLPETKSEIAVPIAVGGEVLGVLDVQQNVVGGLTQTDAALIQSIANQVAIAVQNARAFTRAQQRAEQEKLAVEIGQRIQRAATVDDVLKLAVSELGRAIGAKQAVVEISANPFAQKGKS
jgi:putative methionine-R-sulfoxide reductase with GAF domain